MEGIRDCLGDTQLLDDIDPEDTDGDGLYKDFSNMREFHVLDEILETNDNDDDYECKDNSETDFSSSNEADSEEDFDIQDEEIDAMLEEGI